MVIPTIIRTGVTLTRPSKRPKKQCCPGSGTRPSYYDELAAAPDCRLHLVDLRLKSLDLLSWRRVRFKHRTLWRRCESERSGTCSGSPRLSTLQLASFAFPSIRISLVRSRPFRRWRLDDAQALTPRPYRDRNDGWRTVIHSENFASEREFGKARLASA